jgi:hypothetical protein
VALPFRFFANCPEVLSSRARTSVRLGSAIAAIALLAATSVEAQGWDHRPLRSSTPVPRDGLPVDRGAFQVWLSRNASGLSREQGQRVHERLYVYISDLAKRRGGRFPEVADTAAFELFRFAASVGAVGADRVARALHPNRAALPPPASVPGFKLTLRPPFFALASDDGSWGVCYPYYFMAAPAGRQRASSGVVTELVVLSTLFAPDSGPAGSSQSTVLLAAAPVIDSTKHVTTWLTQLAVSPAPAPAQGAAGAWYASPRSELMQRLVVVRRLPTRVLVAAYLGQAGTFQSNRPHFFDLLATLGSKPSCTASR